ncbi:peptide chain release factor 2 [candidate division FCPU426 bacterium]|nr:peptide chain release factor 2 [candidate division FCPU426 bacterium]
MKGEGHVNTETLEQLAQRIEKFGGIFDITAKQAAILKLEGELSGPDVWNDQQRAKGLNTELSRCRRDVELYHRFIKELEELQVTSELWQESKDGELQEELHAGFQRLLQQIEDFEFRFMFSGPNDRDSAIVSIHPGAGGTESQDWAQMLLRMYLRWAENKGYRVAFLDHQAGEEAGLKSATVEVEGDYAFGYLRSEKGVHRLVRISPFDANKRRHTSFASVDVVPDIEDEIEIVIKDEDIRIDVFRASGAGGQHVNKTESAVRITHAPTGIVVQCQEDRSQIKNRANAMKVLKARLYMRAQEEKAEKNKHLYGEKKDIAFGSQIRSYVFHPYNLIKDHRTGHEVGDVQRIMDGDLDSFLESYLKQQIKS